MSDKQHLFAITSWLLKAAIVFAIFIAAVLALAFIALVLALVAMLFAPSLLEHLEIPRILEGTSLLRGLMAAQFAVAGGLICTILVLFAIRATSGIVETAISGDPFVGDNAERLMRIGWLLLGVMMIQFLTEIIVDAIAPQYDPQIHISGGSDPSPVGLLAVLLIFVLARIFRHGSQMRDELEGTV